MYLNCTEHNINIYRREDVTFAEGSNYLIKDENIKPQQVIEPCGALIRNTIENIPCFIINGKYDFDAMRRNQLIVSRRVADVIKTIGMRTVVPKQIVKDRNNQIIGCLKLVDR